MAAIPTGPGAHFHRTNLESFLILEGTVSRYNGERWLDATPGDFLYLPPGGVHAFSNNSGAPVSMLDRPTETFVLTRAIVGDKLLACGKWR
jgi:mannose-6-phosphate isomerase-like protein (cupin superfamily)